VERRNSGQIVRRRAIEKRILALIKVDRVLWLDRAASVKTSGMKREHLDILSKVLVTRKRLVQTDTSEGDLSKAWKREKTHEWSLHEKLVEGKRPRNNYPLLGRIKPGGV